MQSKSQISQKPIALSCIINSIPFITKEQNIQFHAVRISHSRFQGQRQIGNDNQPMSYNQVKWERMRIQSPVFKGLI